MKKYVLAVLALASIHVFAQPVPAGSAKVEVALNMLVPPPFSAVIDPAVDREVVLKWSAATDWMLALRDAARSGNMRAVPDFASGQITLRAEPKAAQQQVEVPSQATSEPVKTHAIGEAKPVQNQQEAGSANPIAATPKAFTLVPGRRIDEQMAAWASESGWSLDWRYPTSFVVPGAVDITYPGPIDVAVETAIRQLYSNGVQIKLDIWEANKELEITANGK